jgi:hypothetical protein
MAESKRSFGPWDLVEATPNHGPYVVNGYGGTVCDFYCMTDPSAPSTRNGGTSRPVLFTDAVENAAFVVRACNAHDELLAALKAMRDLAKNTPALQGRDFVSLGIQVNNAIAKATGAAQ